MANSPRRAGTSLKVTAYPQCLTCNRTLRATTLTAAERTNFPKVEVDSLLDGMAYICSDCGVYYAR